MPIELAIFTDLKKSCVELATALPRLNDTQRKEMREILLQLKVDLKSSLVLAVEYLNGATRITRKDELIEYLHKAESQLLHTYNELKICAALYHLEDRFNQWFSTVKGVVNAKHISSVKKLVRRIADGERFVLCELQKVLEGLPDFADRLSDARDESEEAYAAEHKRLKSHLREQTATLRAAQREVSSAVNGVLALM